ncbi:MAG: hypothetical protein WBD07_13055 [Vicinamibacterales bacterium]
MIRRAHHLHEDRLFDCYLAERSHESVDPRLAEHLADCAACAARYAELVGLMNELRTEADASADALFTPERLRAQEQQIARRIEHVGRAARIISFPHHGPGERHEAAPRTLPRFAAAAAAAGLFIGIALGASFGWPARVWSTPTFSDTGSAVTPLAARDATLLPDPAADEAFWSDLDRILDSPRTIELQPLDALTPRVREVASLR